MAQNGVKMVRNGAKTMQNGAFARPIATLGATQAFVYWGGGGVAKGVAKGVAWIWQILDGKE